MNDIRILIADDDETILFAFQELLKKDGYKAIIAHNGTEALEKVIKNKPDLIFLDVTMPRADGLEVLQKIKEKKIEAPVIVITGFGTLQTAVKAIQLGAFDYLTKPLDLSKVREVIKKALFSLEHYNITLMNEGNYNANVSEQYDLIGKSLHMQDVFKMIGSISLTPNTTSVLITGESGTGKELVARAIHNNSSNSTEPFVAINCTAFPETLLESELFGYEKGSFTGALDRKIGKFELAACGTIFLDEIGNLSTNLQQKLLRVLQHREFERIGGNIRVTIDARFIAATNVDIHAAVKQGSFREDLFYRLNVASVFLYPLRERKDDLPLLINYFLAKYNFRLKKNVRGFSEEALNLLMSYSFPGNVRELENLIERAVMITKTDIILPDALKEFVYTINKEIHIPIVSESFSEAREHVQHLFEREFISEMLKRSKGNVTQAAKISQMTRQNFLRLMKKYNILSDKYRR